MSDDVLQSYVKKMSYLVIHQNKTYSLYSSLRKIAIDIQVDPSTISKNLKNNDSCYCFSKKNNLLWYIRKI